MSVRAKLYHGDCMNFLPRLGDESVDCIVTDPPYAVGYKQDIYDDTKENVEAKIPLWFKEWYRVLKPNSYAFVYVGVKNINVWIDEGIRAGFDYRNMLATRAFNRGACAPKGNFVFEFQPILVFSKGKGRKFNDVNFFRQSEEWFKDKRNKNPSEFTYAYSNWISSDLAYGTETFGSNKAMGKDVHPNAKNVKLIQFLIEISTNKDEIVLDPFLGSGTTGEAALNVERNFIGCEMNDLWFENSLNRLGNANPLFVEAVEHFGDGN